MLAIVGLGAAINHLWPQAVESALLPTPLIDDQGQPLTRIQTILGNQTETLLLVVLAVTAAAFAVFVFRHWYRVHRMISRGEKFVAQHPWLDIAAVAIFTIGFVITRY